MTHTDWHVAEPMLTRFAHDPRHVDDVSAASIETHLITCAQCRVNVRASADDRALRASWEALADRIDRPRATPLERVADRLGLPTASARIVGLTFALQLAIVASVGALAVLAVLASRAVDSVGPFLIVAPLVPVATVGLLARPADEPAGEMGVVTPMHGFGLVLRRSVVSLVMTLVVLGATTIALPDVGGVALAWALPGLALSITAVLLSTWIRPELAVGVLGLVWVTLLGVSAFVERHGPPVLDWPMFSGTGLLAWLVVACIAAALLTARREHFASLEDYQ